MWLTSSLFVSREFRSFAALGLPCLGLLLAWQRHDCDVVALEKPLRKRFHGSLRTFQVKVIQ
jgi:hypothetical protein